MSDGFDLVKLFNKVEAAYDHLKPFASVDN